MRNTVTNSRESGNVQPGKIFKLALFGLLIPALLACSATVKNPTVHPYLFKPEAAQGKPIKRLLLADVNVDGTPTRSILRKPARRIDRLLKEYVADHGFKWQSGYLFENAWKQAIYTYGDFYDPTSGIVNRETWRSVMAATFEKLREQGQVDAIVFTDVIEHDVQHSGGLQHYARWYGVTRKPATQGAGTGVPLDFNWAQTIKGASLNVTIYSVDGNLLFTSRGGLDTLHAIDMRRPESGFVRRKKILQSESVLQEGLELALHPFIRMKNYPGPKAATSSR